MLFISFSTFPVGIVLPFTRPSVRPSDRRTVRRIRLTGRPTVRPTVRSSAGWSELSYGPPDRPTVRPIARPTARPTGLWTAHPNQKIYLMICCGGTLSHVHCTYGLRWGARRSMGYGNCSLVRIDMFDAKIKAVKLPGPYLLFFFFSYLPRFCFSSMRADAGRCDCYICIFCFYQHDAVRKINE